MLQDVHWSGGAFGYFPSYTLGNIYAAQLEGALRLAVPDLDQRVSRGDFLPLLQWMRENVHTRGSLYLPAELIERATGKPPDVVDFASYLTGKYSAIYGLGGD